jgi:hypothetical protein
VEVRTASGPIESCCWSDSEFGMLLLRIEGFTPSVMFTL